MAEFDRIIEQSTAGLPQDITVKWTYMSRVQIVTAFAEKGIIVSTYLVGQMLNI
jgi:hypothetical protein